MSRIFGYIRVSTEQQSVDSQKNLILRYCHDKQWTVKFIEREMSSRKSLEQRGITSMIDGLKAGDTIIVTELSRLGRSTKEVLEIVDQITLTKKCRLIMLNPALEVDGSSVNHAMNGLIITMFAAVAKMERDFISERTKNGLKALQAKGIKLGKPVGGVQKSIYDKDHDRIKHLHEMGVGINTMIEKHLRYGKYLSLSNYIKRMQAGRIKLQPVSDGKL